MLNTPRWLFVGKNKSLRVLFYFCKLKNKWYDRVERSTDNFFKSKCILFYFEIFENKFYLSHYNNKLGIFEKIKFLRMFAGTVHKNKWNVLINETSLLFLRLSIFTENFRKSRNFFRFR